MPTNKKALAETRALNKHTNNDSKPKQKIQMKLKTSPIEIYHLDEDVRNIAKIGYHQINKARSFQEAYELHNKLLDAIVSYVNQSEIAIRIYASDRVSETDRANILVPIEKSLSFIEYLSIYKKKYFDEIKLKNSIQVLNKLVKFILIKLSPGAIQTKARLRHVSRILKQLGERHE